MTMLLPFLFTFTVAQAEGLVSRAECGTKDFSSQVGRRHNHAMSGYCYADVAADVLGAAVSLRPPEQLSVSHIASNYIVQSQVEMRKAAKAIRFIQQGSGNSNSPPAKSKLQKPIAERRLGDPAYAMQLMIAKGWACRESEAISSPTEEERMPANQLAGYVPGGFLETRLEEVSEVRNIKLCENDLHVSAFADIRKMNPHIYDWAALKGRKKVEQGCHHPVKIPNLQVSREEFSSDRDAIAPGALKLISDLFDRNKPFGVGYDPCRMMNCPFSNKPIHASTVIGRLWNSSKNRCEIRIRDNAGPCKSGLTKSDVICEEGVYQISLEDFAKGNIHFIHVK